MEVVIGAGIYIRSAKWNSLKEIDTRGEMMNNWEVIKVVDRDGYSAFYSEELGLISNISISCYNLQSGFC